MNCNLQGIIIDDTLPYEIDSNDQAGLLGFDDSYINFIKCKLDSEVEERLKSIRPDIFEIPEDLLNKSPYAKFYNLHLKL